MVLRTLKVIKVISTYYKNGNVPRLLPSTFFKSFKIQSRSVNQCPLKCSLHRVYAQLTTVTIVFQLTRLSVQSYKSLHESEKVLHVQKFWENEVKMN